MSNNGHGPKTQALDMSFCQLYLTHIPDRHPMRTTGERAVYQSSARDPIVTSVQALGRGGLAKLYSMSITFRSSVFTLPH